MDRTNNRAKKLLFTVIGMVIVLLSWRFITMGMNYIFRDIKSPVQGYLLGLAAEGVFLAGGMILAIIQKKTHIFKVTVKGMGNGLLVGMYTLVIAGIGLIESFCMWMTGMFEITGTGIITLLISYFLLGMTEEVFFRGILQNNLHEFFGEDSQANIRKAIFFTGLGFGLIHLINIFAGVSVQGAIFQAIANIGSGMLFAAAYYRSHKNLWVCIFLHTIMDFAAVLLASAWGMNEQQIMSSYTMIIVVPGLIQAMIALFATRKSVVERYIHPEKMDCKKFQQLAAANA